jgi:hypothetical protein
MSGSTMLMAISSSGAVTITGEMSGSDAANALLLDGTGSLAFTTTSSFLAVSSSQQQISASLLNVVATSATTGSNTFTKAQYVSDTSNGIGFTSTASFYTDGGLRVGKNAYVSGTAYFNNIVVYGTSSIEYVTSSNFSISDNIISVNTFSPAVRYGGLSVFDSGSTASSGSLLWDSQQNRWLYSNPSGSSYDGGMIISGPRNTTGLGNEQGTTACMLLVGQGGDHLTSSQIYHDSNRTCFYGNALVVSGSNNVGIGDVPSSNYKLYVNGSSTGGGLLVYSGNSCSNYPLVVGDYATNTYFHVNGAGNVYSRCNVGIGTITPIAKLHTCTAYGANNIQAVFSNSNGSINSQVYDTLVIQQDDVTTLKLVERNVGGVDQVFTMTVGDNFSRISTTCANPLQFFVGGNPSACGYNGLSGTAALTITCAGNIGIGNNLGYNALDVKAIGTCATVLQGVAGFYKATPKGGALLISANDTVADIAATWYSGATDMNLTFSTVPSNGVYYERMRIISTGIACFACTVCAPKFWSTGDVNAASTANAKYFRDYYIGNIYSTFAYHASPSPGSYQAFCASQGAILYVTSMHNNGRSTTIINYTNGVTGGMAFTVVNQTSAYSPANVTFTAGANGWLCINYPYAGPTDFMAQVMGGGHQWGGSLTS